MVVWPGPPTCEAWPAPNPLMVPNTPVPGDVSVNYVQGPGGPSKASRSIRITKPTVTAGGVPVIRSSSSFDPSFLLLQSTAIAPNLRIFTPGRKGYSGP